MNITKNQEGTTLTIRLDNRLDTITAPLLDAELKNSLDGVETLIWDFSNLVYISSAGFRVLMVAQRMLDNPDNMKIVHANEMVQTAFTLTGLGDLLVDG